jgi:hypothetical protein
MILNPYPALKRDQPTTAHVTFDTSLADLRTLKSVALEHGAVQHILNHYVKHLAHYVRSNNITCANSVELYTYIARLTTCELAGQGPVDDVGCRATGLRDANPQPTNLPATSTGEQATARGTKGRKVPVAK